MTRHPFDLRSAAVMINSIDFTVDDITNSGLFALDPDAKPNAEQNGIGAYINRLAHDGLIEWTGNIVRSKAPRRKGGAIRVWRTTSEGRDWAAKVLAP